MDARGRTFSRQLMSIFHLISAHLDLAPLAFRTAQRLPIPRSLLLRLDLAGPCFGIFHFD